jgi:hypothetical protein
VTHRKILLVLALVLALVLSSCDRTPHLMPANADSTQASPDTLAILARTAADYWDAGDDVQASTLSARVVLEALRLRPTAPWPERAGKLLDSLGFAAEVAGDEKLLVVNLFSRARGDDASYPFLFWRAGGPHMQPLEASDLHLVAVAGRGFKRGNEVSDTAQAAVLWARRAGGGQQPRLMLWRIASGGRWDLGQMLGTDSLGGIGTAEFTGSDANLALTTRTYRSTPYFDECPSCPHVYHEGRFEWRSDGFDRVEDEVVPSAYAAFTAFIAALVADDRDRAARYAVDPSLVEFAHRHEWQFPARGRWRVAPGSVEGLSSIVFLRGPNDAYRVAFESRDGDWVVAGFEPTVRPME